MCSPGDKVVVISGEFRGKILCIGRVFPDLIELQSLNRDTLTWADFCSVTPEELDQTTRPL